MAEEDTDEEFTFISDEMLHNDKQEILNMKNERSRTLRENVREFAEANPEIAAHMIKDWLHGGEESGKE